MHGSGRARTLAVMWLWIGIAVVVVLLIIWAVMLYNRLVRLRAEVRSNWAQIDVFLKRRIDLIPNLLAGVQRYFVQEEQVLIRVTEARGALGRASGPREAAAADAQLSGALANLFAVTENYPELRSNETLMQFQAELTDTEDKIAGARRLYNNTVERYTATMQTFPSVLVARLGGFREEEYFTVPDDDPAREAPSVSYDPPTLSDPPQST